MPAAALMTAEQLLFLPRGGCRHELIAGHLRIMPLRGWRHGEIASTLNSILGHHVAKHGLGMGLGPGAGFILSRNPDTVRAADFAFIAHENLPEIDPPEGYWLGAPDLAVEVISSDDKPDGMDEKIQAWLISGAKMVWVANAHSRTVTVFRFNGEEVVHAGTDQLDAGDVLRGFRCVVEELFE